MIEHLRLACNYDHVFLYRFVHTKRKSWNNQIIGWREEKTFSTSLLNSETTSSEERIVISKREKATYKILLFCQYVWLLFFLLEMERFNKMQVWYFLSENIRSLNLIFEFVFAQLSCNLATMPLDKSIVLVYYYNQYSVKRERWNSLLH